MDTIADDPSNVSGSTNESNQSNKSLQSRAYQIEMFEQAMQENVIVAVCTSKSDVAPPSTNLNHLEWKQGLGRLKCELRVDQLNNLIHALQSSEIITRIQSETTDRSRVREVASKGSQARGIDSNALTRNAKRIWFCAPSVVLAQQQHAFLASQLLSNQIRLITGLDNVQFWSTQSIWDAVLDKIDIVVSTPQVLLDALSHGFLSMQSLSLLVFDEVHHCLANHPMAVIMQRFYHPLLEHSEMSQLPHVLGLTASPITNKASLLEELERNVCAVCKTPTIQIEDYKQYTHLPTLERVSYDSSSFELTATLKALRVVDVSLSLVGDPTLKWLESRAHTSLLAREKLQKIQTAGRTPVMKQVHSLFGHAQHIHDNIGAWAADLYVRTCVTRLHEAVLRHESLVPSLADHEQQYLDKKLQPVLSTMSSTQNEPAVGQLIAPKTQSVINYMCEQYRPGVTVIIFVKRRSAAFALTKLLQNSPSMKCFSVFSFVGSANPANRSLVDLADMQLQSEAFADFQAGKRNVCIATQVMEEGVDVQATNLVIRFDEPETFRSFVQSRGRARRPDSKFVMVNAVGESSATQKLGKWRELERTMKEQYSDLSREVHERTAFEQQQEDGNELYRVSTTGALLTYNNAVQHLEHFCATLMPDEFGEPARPVTIIQGTPLGAKIAQVVLPSSVHGSLQVTNGLQAWRTERMAKKDAAFQTYKRLHTAGLVNNNLLPWPRDRSHAEKIENRDSKYEVKAALSVWACLLESYSESSYTTYHRVRITGHDFAMPDVMILLPIQIDHDLQFNLYPSGSSPILVSITADYERATVPSKTLHEVTSHLFKTILGRRLKQTDMAMRLPYFVIPGVAMVEPSAWLDQVRNIIPLPEMVFSDSLIYRSYLLQHKREEILYRWQPSATDKNSRRYSIDRLVDAERLSKQLNFLQNVETGETDETELATPDIRKLRVGDCFVSCLPEAYAGFMLLLPSISYMLEVTLRGQMAAEGPLNPIRFSNSRLVAKALTSSSASSEYNYESLEFVGDALLKYYAATQVFFEHPTLTEGGLTNQYAKIVNNARLQRATKDLGLDAYITLESFSGYKWNLAVNKVDTNRQMSSKTLADTIEALIGAAFLDPRNHVSEEVVLSALTHIFPEVKWKLPTTHVQDFHRLSPPAKTNIARLEDVENMLGYKFKSRSLLLEALTQSSIRVGAQSFERLEFLGDAVLERLVVVALSKQCGLQLEPRDFKYRRDALCNRWFLAFLAMELNHKVIRNEIETTTSGQTKVSPVSKVIRLVDHVRTSSSPQVGVGLQRQKAETTFLEARDAVLEAFDTGKRFPWVALHSVDTSKSYSDIIESTLGAVFIDSNGSLASCASVLESLGVFKLVHRFATEPDLELIPPIAKLTIACPSVSVDCTNVPAKTRGNSHGHICQISLDGEVLARSESQVSRKHAEACAAELALSVLGTRTKSG